jgi:hypothetical protein
MAHLLYIHSAVEADGTDTSGAALSSKPVIAALAALLSSETPAANAPLNSSVSGTAAAKSAAVVPLQSDDLKKARCFAALALSNLCARGDCAGALASAGVTTRLLQVAMKGCSGTGCPYASGVYSSTYIYINVHICMYSCKCTYICVH